MSGQPEKRLPGRPHKADSLPKTFGIKVDEALHIALKGADKDIIRDALRHCIEDTDETFVEVRNEMEGGV